MTKEIKDKYIMETDLNDTKNITITLKGYIKDITMEWSIFKRIFIPGITVKELIEDESIVIPDLALFSIGLIIGFEIHHKGFLEYYRRIDW